jgi:2-polyprenyl-3-methyl-5-hydroxy-6-metoxy-1,4-benzoquinol methylase
MTACFEPRRFRSTVPYYARYRVPYPAPLISFVHERCGLRAGSRVLDLGCGPGQLAVVFATLGCAMTAMDPEPEMLAAMKQRATAADASLEAVRASSHDLDGSFGHFDLVAMGRSFHWMDRDETLNRLNEIVAPTGAVVLFGIAVSRRRGLTGQPSWTDSPRSLRPRAQPSDANGAARHANRTRRYCCARPSGISSAMASSLARP